MYLLILFVTTIDVTSYFNGPGSQVRYALVLPPIVAVFLYRLRSRTPLIRRPTPADMLLLVLFAWGLLGTAYGVTHSHTKDGMFPTFVPMAIAFLPLLVPEVPTRGEVVKILRVIGIIGAAYVVLNAFVNSHAIASLAAYRAYRNALLCYVAMGLVATAVLRRRARLALLLALTAVIFVTYPSGTFVLVAVGVLTTLWVTGRSGSWLRPAFLGVVFVVAIGFALIDFQQGVSATSGYFQIVGKANDNATRVALWSSGLRDFARSPLIGTGFTGNTTTVTSVPTQRTLGVRTVQLPFHNDYVLFLANGGVLGFGLLVGWILLTQIIVLRRYWAFLAAGMTASANLLRVLLVGFNAFFTAAATNPEFTGLARSATIFSIYGLMMVLGTPASVRPQEHARVNVAPAASRPSPPSAATA